MSKFTQYIKRTFRYIFHGVPVVINRVEPKIAVLSKNELLTGRTALITGGTSGIGMAIAKAFIEAGAFVVITSRSKKRVDAVVKTLCEDLKCEGKILGLELDNTQIGTNDSMITNILASVPNGTIDILVNNAGIGGGEIATTSVEEYDNVMDTNLKGMFFLSRELARYMIQNRIQGNILNIASSSSVRPATSAYMLSKWGVRGLTEGLARMLVKHNIVVNAIAPGPTATPMIGADSENIYRGESLIKRCVTTEEIAQMSVMLVSDSCRSIIGDVIYMTGGSGNIDNSDFNYEFKI